MKTIILALATFALCSCATITPYSGPTSSDTASVALEAAGLMKHAALQDDVLVIHLLKGESKLGTIKLTTDSPRETIQLDRGQATTLRFMSIQPHFGGYSACNRDVPFVADGLAYTVSYSTSKSACVIRINRIDPNGHSSLVSELPGVVSGVQYKAEVVR